MSWIGPTILFSVCVLGAAMILFFQLVARCDRMIESWHERRQEEER